MEKKNRKLSLRLKRKDRIFVNDFLKKGVAPVRVIKRVQLLSLLDKGISPPAVSSMLGTAQNTVRTIGWRYVESKKLGEAIYERPRPGQKKVLNPMQEAAIIALVCSEPPLGFKRWTVKIILREVKRQGIADKVERETIRVLLTTHHLKPWRKKNVVCWEDKR